MLKLIDDEIVWIDVPTPGWTIEMICLVDERIDYYFHRHKDRWERRYGRPYPTGEDHG